MYFCGHPSAVRVIHVISSVIIIAHSALGNVLIPCPLEDRRVSWPEYMLSISHNLIVEQLGVKPVNNGVIVSLFY